MRPPLALLPFALLLAAAAVPCAGQGVGWSGSAEVNGSLFFGSRSEWLATTHGHLARSDSTLEVRADGRLGYAETAADTGRSTVSARNWQLSMGLDWFPFGRWSPFVFGSTEASLQLRIHNRWSAGAGAKYTLVRDSVSEASVSLAVLGERTTPLALAPGAPAVRTNIARWSLRARAQHRLNHHLQFEHVTFYQPIVGQLDRYLVNTVTTLALDLVRPVALTLTLQDLYDSEARARGARSNHDGHLVIGARTSF
ncbi:MAG TPA: DUF481 domain-containing protein [Gemmatimonadaceae bacterium]|nr:DUF481 domain-containing protein [Gemmatimonadaceae bacterium]